MTGGGNAHSRRSGIRYRESAKLDSVPRSLPTVDRSADAAFDPLADLDPARFPPLVGAAIEYPAGTRLARHDHPVGQLVYAAAGTMRIDSASGLYVVPPLMAVWVPPGLGHAIAMPGRVAMRTLYVRPGLVSLPRDTCAVLGVSALLRELILALVALPGSGRRPGPRLASLRRLILDELRAAPRQALGLVAPRDRRVAPLVEALLAEPGDPRRLADWAARLGASERTIERIFLAETRLSFRAWRQRARLLQAVLRLAEGQPVTTVALDLGYASPSAFTLMFRRALGVPPSRYVDSSAQGS